MKKMIKKLKDEKEGDALLSLRKKIKSTIRGIRKMKAQFNITESELSVSPIKQFRSPSPCRPAEEKTEEQSGKKRKSIPCKLSLAQSKRSKSPTPTATAAETPAKSDSSKSLFVEYSLGLCVR